MRKALLGSVLIVLAACSGTSNVTIPGGDAVDSGTTNSDAGGTTDGAAPKDASGTSDATDPGKDAGLVVTEEPAPTCHDLKQVAALVTPTNVQGDPPMPTPLSNLPTGLFVVKEITIYGFVATPQQPTRTTAYFTGKREYYLADDGSDANTTPYTIDYEVKDDTLSRTIFCPPNAQSVPDATFGSSPNGFTLYIPTNGPGNSTSAVRYEHAN